MLENKLKLSRAAYLSLSRTETEHRNDMLRRMRDALIANRASIESANAEDVRVCLECGFHKIKRRNAPF